MIVALQLVVALALDAAPVVRVRVVRVELLVDTLLKETIAAVVDAAAEAVVLLASVGAREVVQLPGLLLVALEVVVAVPPVELAGALTLLLTTDLAIPVRDVIGDARVLPPALVVELALVLVLLLALVGVVRIHAVHDGQGVVLPLAQETLLTLALETDGSFDALLVAMPLTERIAAQVQRSTLLAPLGLELALEVLESLEIVQGARLDVFALGAALPLVTVAGLAGPGTVVPDHAAFGAEAEALLTLLTRTVLGREPTPQLFGSTRDGLDAEVFGLRQVELAIEPGIALFVVFDHLELVAVAALDAAVGHTRIDREQGSIPVHAAPLAPFSARFIVHQG